MAPVLAECRPDARYQSYQAHPGINPVRPATVCGAGCLAEEQASGTVSLWPALGLPGRRPVPAARSLEDQQCAVRQEKQQGRAL